MTQEALYGRTTQKTVVVQTNRSQCGKVNKHCGEVRE